MPLPPALLARLKKRGIVKASEAEPSAADQPEEEVIAEDYDDISRPVGGGETRVGGPIPGCPNKWNLYHECSAFCQQQWGAGKLKESPHTERKRLRMLRKYPLPEGWSELYDPGTGRHYYWRQGSEDVTWMPPRHPRAKISLPAEKLRELISDADDGQELDSAGSEEDMLDDDEVPLPPRRSRESANSHKGSSHGRSDRRGRRVTSPARRSSCWSCSWPPSWGQPPRLPHSELPWSRVAPGVSTEACDSAPGSADRLYWLRNGQRLPPPTPDRFWEPGAYLCVREGNRTVSLQRALLVTEEDDGGLCTAGLPTDEDRSRPALIAQRWALTAAHCLPERSDTQLAVLLGATRQSGPRIGVLRAVPHPDYVRGTPSREHDVALLLLERRAERLTVACLPPAGGYLERFSQGVLFGWGRVGPRGGPALKLQRHRCPSPAASAARRPWSTWRPQRFAPDSARPTVPTPAKGTAGALGRIRGRATRALGPRQLGARVREALHLRRVHARGTVTWHGSVVTSRAPL
ncbi:hypothetical protein HPB49_025762 [Dermacentor silvarum]|nr:hypothetical protein HPB49_025762 [Dermacentor silvarum]